MKIFIVERVTRINHWLEILHGTPDIISWEKGYTREDAYQLYEYFKNQPERSKREDSFDCERCGGKKCVRVESCDFEPGIRRICQKGCGALNTMET